MAFSKHSFLQIDIFMFYDLPYRERRQPKEDWLHKFLFSFFQIQFHFFNVEDFGN